MSTLLLLLQIKYALITRILEFAKEIKRAASAVFDIAITGRIDNNVAFVRTVCVNKHGTQITDLPTAKAPYCLLECSDELPTVLSIQSRNKPLDNTQPCTKGREPMKYWLFLQFAPKTHHQNK